VRGRVRVVLASEKARQARIGDVVDREPVVPERQVADAVDDDDIVRVTKREAADELWAALVGDVDDAGL
jgi:hypothetical protein